MSDFRIKLSLPDIVLTEAEIENFKYFQQNRNDQGGTTPEPQRDRAFLHWLIQERLDTLIAYELQQRGPDTNWRLRGRIDQLFLGTGEFEAPNIFRDTTGPFTNPSNPVGKLIRIPAQGGDLRNARGIYHIVDRISNQRVVIDGVIPGVFAGLDWELREYGKTDAVVVLEVL